MNVCLMLPAASRRRCNDNRSCRAFCGTCYFAARFAECADAAALPLGLVARAQRAHIGEPALTEGSTIYCGDYVSTEDGGSVLIRIGESSLELQSASAAISRVSQPQTLRAGSAGQRSFADCCRPKPVHAGDRNRGRWPHGVGSYGSIGKSDSSLRDNQTLPIAGSCINRVRRRFHARSIPRNSWRPQTTLAFCPGSTGDFQFRQSLHPYFV